jgi:hypothetical protein
VPWGADQIYTIAASRMGNLQNPRWCFSETPFNPTLADSSALTSTTDPTRFVILQGFNAAQQYLAYFNAVQHVACETLD